MRIGIFGGSFNPPHNMHLNIALKLVNKGYVDKVIFVPTGSKYTYKDNLVLDTYRFNMIRDMIGDYPCLEVSDFELKDYVVYTCDTLDYFREIRPEDEIYFICGADNLDYINLWKNGNYILNNYKILLIKRNNYDIDELLERYKEYNDNIIVSDIEMRVLSSTYIRDCLKNSVDVSSDIHPKVLKYILDKGLYR